MRYELSALLATAGLFLGMLMLLDVGRRVGVRRMAADPEGARTGTGVVEGALFGLLGLLIAFTFSGAASRFDVRRHLIIEETNAIGTAYLRLDLLAPAAQPSLRDGFRRYVDKRLEIYRVLSDAAAAERALAEMHVVYVILDIEFPRFGLIRVDAFDQVLADLRQGMK